MNNKEVLSHIDHTLLNPCATWPEMLAHCDEALKYGTACVCIPPCYVDQIKQTYSDTLSICTVIGFPLGYNVTSVKVAELRKAIEDGADEIDMVVNITDVKNGNFHKVEKEISDLKDAAGNHILKVIVETCYLTEEEKIALCKAVTNAGADFIKTSTGFGTDGAHIEDIKLFKEHIGSNIRIKAAGGIKSIADLELFISEGCDRIGTSSAVKILCGQEAQGY